MLMGIARSGGSDIANEQDVIRNIISSHHRE